MKKKIKMATGGQAGTMQALAGSVPNILDAILSLTENQSYSKEPIVNASNVRSMSTPYKFAFGGDVADLDEEQLAELQAKADEQGMTIEEILSFWYRRSTRRRMLK